MNPNPSILPTGAATLTLEIEIAASCAVTWRTMINDVAKWWRADFLVCKQSRGMSIEPRVGGLLYETAAGGGTGFAWGQLIRFEPEAHLAFTAQIVPPWGGPALSVVQINLEAEGKGTKLTLTDSLIGNLTEELLSNMREGWQLLFGEGGLQSLAEAS